MKVLLICSGGMSTQILITSLEKEAHKQNIQNFEAQAIGANELEDFKEEFDIILVAPQIKHKFDQINEVAQKKGKKIYQIQMMEYNPIGAPKLLKNVVKAMEQ
ncbi:hypothetical protein V2E24_01815 [Mycoplasmopsis ciconiae]|uniref:PTS EIIB type-3 domain-containing protein n=1 Tax=Mycoplasmopsis ciconiae TaxID=561067 RepID=A0ABU7ML96_9BACT|nr:hypothetical protein [Mycoplasmopsis ciconiae]